MRKGFLFLGKLFFCFTFFIMPFVLKAKAETKGFMDTVFSQDQKGGGKQKGPTVITADTMDMDIKNNLITLIGNVVVDDPANRLSADKMLVYLQDAKGEDSKKKLKAIVALGNVIMARKAITEEEKKNGKREAHSGRADYDAITGIIIMTENPVLYQGDNYMKGDRITLWKNSERMKIEGDQSSGRSSHIVISQGTDTGTTTDTGVGGFKLGL
jgi:lipopolysaccharide export system protein LptA